MGLFDDVKASRGAAPAAPEVAHTGAVAPDALADHLARAKAAVGTVARARSQKKEKAGTAPAVSEATRVGAMVHKEPNAPKDVDPAALEAIRRHTPLRDRSAFEAALSIKWKYKDHVWVLERRQEYLEWRSQSQRLFTVAHFHTTPDTEPAFWYWKQKRHSGARRIIGMHPYFTPVAARFQSRPYPPPFDRIPEEHLEYDTLAHRYGCIGFDVGMGILDQHVRPENHGHSESSSIDIDDAVTLDAIEEYLTAVPIAAMVSLNDRIGLQIADRPNNVRNVLRSLHEFEEGRVTKRMTIPRWFDYACIMFDAANNFMIDMLDNLRAEYEDEAQAYARLFDYRHRALRWETIMQYLPEQVTVDRAKAEARTKTQEIIDNVILCRRVNRFDVRALLELTARVYKDCETRELDARDAFLQLLEDFKRDTEEAIAYWKADKDLADTQVATIEPSFIPDVTVVQEHPRFSPDRTRAFKQRFVRRGPVWIYPVISDSMSVGRACRHDANKRDTTRMLQEVTDHWTQTLGKPLTDEQLLIIRRAVGRRRAASLVVQMRDLVMEGKKVVSLRYNLASSGVKIGVIHGAIMGALYSRVYLPQGYDPPTDGNFDGPGEIIFTRRRDGARVVAGFVTSWDGSAGNHFTTNRVMLPAQLTPDELVALVQKGLKINSEKIHQARAAWGKSPVQSRFERINELIAQQPEFIQAP